MVGAKDVENDVLILTVRGTTDLLCSALAQKSLEAIVVTSSFALVFDAMHGFRSGFTYTPRDWNPISYETAAAPDLDVKVWPSTYQHFITYIASEKLAEKAAWDFYHEHQPKWRLSMINPT